MVILIIGDNTKYAAQVIETSDIGSGSCSITPTKKTYLLEPFQIKCTNFTGASMFHIYQNSMIHGETSNILLATNNEGFIRLILGVGEIIIRIYNNVGYYKTFNLTVS